MSFEVRPEEGPRIRDRLLTRAWNLSVEAKAEVLDGDASVLGEVCVLRRW